MFFIIKSAFGYIRAISHLHPDSRLTFLRSSKKNIVLFCYLIFNLEVNAIVRVLLVS